jgi:AcrR family transcriptional regulator
MGRVSHVRTPYLRLPACIECPRSLSIHRVAVESLCVGRGVAYTPVVPRLWTDTIDTHRRTVRDATIDATASLVAEYGLRSVTMTQIAELTGIGRATLYKYFPDVEAILLAWHEREIAGHLQLLAEVRDRTDGAGARLEAVLETYATLAHGSHGHHDAELASILHRDEQVAPAEHALRDMVQSLIVDAAAAGDVRDDIAPGELMNYCLHAIAGASRLPSKTAIRRLVSITLAGVRPPN